MNAQKRTIRNVLITGITGSGGSYLAEYIVANHPAVKVHGLARWHSTTTQDNLGAIRDRVDVHEADLTDFAATFSVLRDVKPDAVFHLASYANVRESFTNPAAVLENNIKGTVNLFEAVHLAGLDPYIQLCSTSEVYGQVDPDRIPTAEDAPVRPINPYAVSKVTQDLLGHVYWVSYGMKIITTRMYTYINPRRADLFASSFARQVARIEAGLQESLVHGNLDSARTVIDVRDAMRAYWEAIEKCTPGEAYNIGGTKTITVREFLEILKGKAKVAIPTRQDSRLIRPADITVQIPNVGKFMAATGWKPQYSFEDSVDLMLDYWRARVRAESFGPDTLANSSFKTK